MATAKTTTKKLKLSVTDRLQVNGLLPQKGNFLDLLDAKHIAKKVEFTDKELNELNMEQKGNRMLWKPENAKDKHVEFTVREISFLNNRIEELDKANELDFAAMDLYVKIKEAEDEKAES